MSGREQQVETLAFRVEGYWPGRSTREGATRPLEERLDQFVGLLVYLARKSTAFQGENNQRRLDRISDKTQLPRQDAINYLLDNRSAVLKVLR